MRIEADLLPPPGGWKPPFKPPTPPSPPPEKPDPEKPKLAWPLVVLGAGLYASWRLRTRRVRA